MQPIERYGVITLMLLVVTIFAVAMWEDGPAEEEGETGTPVADGRAVQRPGERAPSRPEPRPEARERAPETPREARTSVAQNGREGRATAPAGQPVPVTATSPERSRTLLTLEPEMAPGSSRTPEPSIEAMQPVVQSPLRSTPSSAGDERTVAADFREPRRPQQPSTQSRRPEAASGSSDRTETPAERPATSTAKQAEAAGSALEHRVASGESLSVIAQKRLGGASRWREIAALNGIDDPTRVRVGQVLRLPAGAAAGSAPQAGLPRAVESSSGSGVHVVQRGDVLGKIAQERLGSARRWKEIVELNPGIDPDRLVVGARLTLPADSRNAPAPQSTSAPARVVSLTPSSALRRESKVR